MKESVDIPNLPGYISIKEAADLLGVSDKREVLFWNACAGKARAALAAFAEAYPESMRAASAEVILKSLGGTE